MSFFMIRRFGVMVTAVASTATPLFTAVVGMVLLHEVITPLMVFGGLCLIGGVLVVNVASGVDAGRGPGDFTSLKAGRGE